MTTSRKSPHDRRGLVLSLFPGIGLLDLAFEEAGFCIVRGPDLLWGGDIARFDPPAGRFDGVIGGPPCQAFSRLRHIVAANGFATADNLVPEFERVIREAAPQWFLMENVEAAPAPDVPGYFARDALLRDVWVGGETNRLRRFTFGHRASARRFEISTLALHRPDPSPAAMASGGMRQELRRPDLGPRRSRRGAMRYRGFKTARDFREHCRLQGLPDGFDLPPFTTAAKIKAVGNGVSLAMGRAVAAAVSRALEAAT